MNRLFLDTNIILDLLGRREPFYEPIAKLATIADNGDVRLVASPLSFATAHYILSKYYSADVAKDKLRKFKIICEVSSFDESIIEKGLNSSFRDFEDSLQYFCAIQANCEIILTRNAKDFSESLLPVMAVDEYLKAR